MKKTHREIEKLFTALDAIDVKGADFNYAIARNVQILTPIIKSLDHAKKPTEEYLKYENEWRESVEKFAKKDKDGNPIKTEIAPNIFQYEMADQAGFNKEGEKIKKKYKETLAQREKQIKDYETLLDKEEEFSEYKIKKESIPEELNTKSFSAIIELIDEQ